MVQSIIQGFSAYLKGAKVLFQRKMLVFAFIPGLIALAILALFFGFSYNVSDDLAELVLGYYPYEWGRVWLEKILQVFGGLFVFFIGFILLKNVVLAVTAPFMSMLSAQIEGHQGSSFSTSKFIEDLLRGIHISLRNLVRELGFTLILFLIGLIPILTPVTTVLIFLVQSYYAGFGVMDFTLERHTSVAESVAFVRSNKAYALGLGAIFMLLLYTGIGFIIALPLATAGSTAHILKKL